MVDMDYIEQEGLTNNNNIYSPVNEQPIDYNNNTSEESSNIIFVDTVFYMFCMITIIPSLTRCIYVLYIKNKFNDNNIQQNPIDNLQSLIITNEQPDDICTICLEEFKFNEELKKLKCNHIFHKECLEPWLNNKRKCPICRSDVI